MTQDILNDDDNQQVKRHVANGEVSPLAMSPKQCHDLVLDRN